MSLSIWPEPHPLQPRRWAWVGLVVFAYLFAVAVRLVLAARIGGDADVLVNGELPISVSDGFYYASSVKAELTGVLAENQRLMPWNRQLLTTVAWFLTDVLGVALSTVTIYLPALLAGLIVIPICGLGRLVAAPLWGVAAALIAGIGWSYYNRTTLGAFDTDVFAVTLPLLVIWALASACLREPGDRLASTAWAAFVVAAGPFFYQQADVLSLAVVAGFVGYTLLFMRHDADTPKLLLLLLVALVGVTWWPLRVGLVAVMWLGLRSTRVTLSGRWLWVLCGVTAILVLVTNAKVGYILAVLGFTSGSRAAEGSGAHFESTRPFVRELGGLSADVIARRISGSVLALVVGAAGWLLLVLRHRVFLLTLPLIALGLFAGKGGLRFTIYAVPVAALGAAWFALAGTAFVARQIDRHNLQMAFRWGGALVVTGLVLWPNLEHATTHQPRVATTQADVDLMTALAGKLQPHDYTLAWWDHGYPLWFYADTNTLTDGGRHNLDNFVVAKVLYTTSQRQAANLARVAIERWSTFGIARDAIWALLKKARKAGQDANAYLASLDDEAFRPAAKTRDIYVYLPKRILPLMAAIGRFASRDLVTGKRAPPPFWFYAELGQRNAAGDVVLRQPDAPRTHVATMSLEKGTFAYRGVTRKLKAVHRSGRDLQTGQGDVRTTLKHADGAYHVILAEHYGILVVDQQLFDSVFVQLFALGRADPRFFEFALARKGGVVYRIIGPDPAE